MKIFIVTHERNSDDPDSCSYNIISAHLSREKAEATLKKEKEKCLRQYWKGYEDDDCIEVDHDIAGLFEIHDNLSCDRDEILIHEEIIKD